MKLTVVTIALVSNYLLGWTYAYKSEETIPVHDTVRVSASDKYSRMTPLKWFFLGKNYRREWSAPVSMPVFHLKTTKGGFHIERLGGGQQTKSLHLINNDGTEWVLRSVDKNVKEALPENLQGTFVQNIVQDQISAAYPYAVLTIYDLSTAVGVPSPTAELYYIPDDPALGKYQSLFARTVCFLYPKNINGKDIDTDPTEKIRAMLDSSNHYFLRQKKILSARLLDMLIADWDRHIGQWDWAFADSGYAAYIYPVPEDRDQAFFLSQGALTKIATWLGMPHLIGFRKNPKKLKKLNHKVHDFDRYYLNQLNRSDWEKSIKNFQNQMTDAVITNALHKLPPEVYNISGEEITEKLKSRRDGLLKEGLKYYDFIARHVTIYSSRQPEAFHIVNYPDSVTVVVRRLDDNKTIYHRTFYKDETEELTISGVLPDDTITQTGDASIPISYKEKN